MPTAEQLPVVWKVLVDELGYVWVRPYDPMKHSFALGGGPGVGGKWLVFSPDGNRVGEIQMPPKLEASAITQNAVVGISRDEMGVESVQVYRLWRH
jgi:hypothetical protein